MKHIIISGTNNPAIPPLVFRMNEDCKIQQLLDYKWVEPLDHEYINAVTVISKFTGMPDSQFIYVNLDERAICRTVKIEDGQATMYMNSPLGWEEIEPEKTPITSYYMGYYDYYIEDPAINDYNANRDVEVSVIPMDLVDYTSPVTIFKSLNKKFQYDAVFKSKDEDTFYKYIEGVGLTRSQGPYSPRPQVVDLLTPLEGAGLYYCDTLLAIANSDNNVVPVTGSDIGLLLFIKRNKNILLNHIENTDLQTILDTVPDQPSPCVPTSHIEDMIEKVKSLDLQIATLDLVNKESQSSA